MPRLEHGTSLIIPAGASAQIAGSVPLTEVRIAEPAPASLVVPETFAGEIGRSVTFARGAYVMLSAASGSVQSGTVLFLAPGTTVEIAGKIVGPTGQPPVCAPCESPLQTVGLMFVAVVLGGLLVSAMLKE